MFLTQLLFGCTNTVVYVKNREGQALEGVIVKSEIRPYIFTTWKVTKSLTDSLGRATVLKNANTVSVKKEGYRDVWLGSYVQDKPGLSDSVSGRNIFLDEETQVWKCQSELVLVGDKVSLGGLTFNIINEANDRIRIINGSKTFIDISIRKLKALNVAQFELSGHWYFIEYFASITEGQDRKHMLKVSADESMHGGGCSLPFAAPRFYQSRVLKPDISCYIGRKEMDISQCEFN